jgi:uncharacterized OB-fold protein
VTARGPAIRLLPRVDGDSGFFWTSGADGRLRFLRCAHCHYYVHPPAPRCPECLSEAVVPEVVSGRATVVAHTVNVHGWIPGSEPYVIGLVAIDEQDSVRLTTNLVDVAPDEIEDGMRVEVVFEQNDDVFLPLFRPVTDGGADGGTG